MGGERRAYQEISIKTNSPGRKRVCGIQLIDDIKENSKI